ncbi:MAG: RNA polymerase sigma factor, partial [Bacteroidetes bacterium]|nr:RNA polymerase sigma factor [Bacteroidota bacterium]
MVDYSDKTDEELLLEYHLEKNPRFLNIIFSRYTDVGFRTALRYMRNSSDAEDVLQLAFIQFLQNLHTFREGSTTVKPWLMKMIVNTSIKKLQEENSRKHRQDKIASQRFSEHARQEDEVVEVNNQADVKIQIKKLVENLPEKYRSPIWLVLYEGFTYPEVASVLDLPEKTVR